MADAGFVYIKNSSITNAGRIMNIFKWLLSTTLLLAGVLAFQYLPQYGLLIRAFIVLFSMLAALGLAVTTPQGKQLLLFINGAKAETKKVVWPTKQETIQSTIVVMIAVVVFSVFMWLVDSLLLLIMSWVTA
jgi:preprotein translocase subunit SecE